MTLPALTGFQQQGAGVSQVSPVVILLAAEVELHVHSHDHTEHHSDPQPHQEADKRQQNHLQELANQSGVCVGGRV